MIQEQLELELLDLLDHKAKPVLLVGLLVDLDLLALLVLQTAHLGLLVHKANLVLLGPWVQLVTKVLQDHKVRKEFLDLQVHKDPPVLRVLLVHKVIVLLDHLALLVHKVRLAHKVLLVLWALLALLAQKVHRVPLVQTEYKVIKVQMVQLGHLARRVLKALLAQLDLLV